ncbi:MAG TPA: CooT family nickel-binding protein [Dehalococcoidia bacterium]|jgi:predicted RNA-binding protein|nr:CooT family nickel-binding protein [Dehalococcoidia bacterium]
MCLGKAYIEADNKRELILDSIALIEIADTKLKLSTIFGDQKEIEARIKEIDFEGSRIILTKIPTGKR